ncbi:hypothetical protein B6U84_00715 [Candidatus Bathyarchaeota archaeon ex4484_40]|nr:MAG: hypothetical protein B6U84_00715 [Candidatus Bathyarchaeota archaeon ex4484_40]
METVREYLSEKASVLKYVALGGLISSLIAFVLRIILLGAIYMILKNFDCLGVRVYGEALLATTLIMIGGTYIPGGFIGGLYVGYKVKDEKLRILLLFSALLGCTVLLALMFFFLGYRVTYYLEMERELRISVFLPLLGVLVGTYLGGYSVNWGKEEEKISEGKLVLEEAPISLALTDIRGVGSRRAKRLRAAGIETVEDLVKASPRVLSAKTGIPEKTIQRIIEHAKRMIEKESLRSMS